MNTEDHLFDYDSEEECPICGSSQLWEYCDACGGNGYIEVYESDPMWYEEGDTERCDMCEGEGGWWLCTNRKNHPEEVKS